MKKLLYTDNIGFDMTDWEREPIERVFAGTNCIMAVTLDGRVLQKTDSSEYTARTQYWQRIRQLSVSKCISGLAIGLVEDGTCMISKRALRRITGPGWNNASFDSIHEQIKGWKDLVQVEVSDSFFGLDRAGKVHAAAFNSALRQDYCPELERWTGVKRIVVGNQNSIFGITEEGRLLCAGSNLLRGPHGDIRKALRDLEGVVDVFPTGSECETVLIAFRDGSVRDHRGSLLPVRTVPAPGPRQVFDGTFYYNVLFADAKGELIRWNSGKLNLPFNGKGRIISFASGDHNYGTPFALAMIED